MLYRGLLSFDSSALDSLQLLRRHCVTCVAESEAGSSFDVSLPTGIPSTCLLCKEGISVRGISQQQRHW